MTAPAADQSLAVIGTGLMGEPMALRLVAAGYPVAVWNRTGEKVRMLVAAGARAAVSVEDAVANADITILMLSNAQAVSSVLFEQGVAAALRPGSTVIDMSSIPPDVAREHAARLESRGIQHLDAPVSGGTRGAGAGTLAIMVGGDGAVFDRVLTVLQVLGRPTRVGPHGTGQLTKLANQTIVGITIGAVAEALLLVAAGGADPVAAREALRGGFADSMILQQHGARMLERQWNPGGPLKMQVKDLRTVLSAAAAYGMTLPLCAQAAQLFEDGMSSGLGDYDHSAVLLELERLNPGRRLGSGADRRPASDT